MTCPFCEEAPLVEFFLEEGNPADVILCCEEQRELTSDPEYFRELLAAETGIAVKRVVDTGTGFVLDFGLTLGPVRQKEAKAFINRHHRHNAAPPGWRWGFGLYNGWTWIGVVWLGRPRARQLPQTRWVEVNRLCLRTDVSSQLTRHACSKGYGAAAREAKRRGFERIITYTLVDEPGTSLRASGWTTEWLTRGKSWNTPARPREDTAPTCDKVRWEKELR